MDGDSGDAEREGPPQQSPPHTPVAAHPDDTPLDGVEDAHDNTPPRVPSPLADANEDTSEVGHEVAPPRTTPDGNDVAYFARLHPAADELADNAASDVRRVPSASSAPAPDYEDIPPPLPQAGNDGAAKDGRPQSGGVPGAATASTSVPSTVAPSAVTRQPCHGTQVDADADILADTGAAAVGDDAAMAETGGDAAATAAATGASPPQWSLPPQAAHGTAEVTVTLLPMQALARITVAVHNPHLYRPQPAASAHGGRRGSSSSGDDEDEENERSDRASGGAAGNGSESASPHWVLMAKDLFEGLAQHLSLHPESFYVFHQHRRLRFTGTLFLDCDVTSAPDATGAPAANSRAEPVWVSVTFPDPANEAAAASADPRVPFPAPSASQAAEEEAAEAQASLAAVPSHLAHLAPNDYVTRCIQVRRRKYEIPPRSLVEGRRQGYSYNDVIKQMQTLHDIADNDGQEGGDSNFVTMAIVQDSPAPPGKPFLGGYRDRRRASHVLLHAATQLYHRDLEYSPFARTGAAGPGAGDRASRQTQTFGISRSCQTHREACAQTPRVDLLLETAHDFVVVARPYFTAAALRELQDEMAVMIQKMYRQWKARQVRAELEAAESARQHRAGARQRREEALHAAVEDAAQLRLDDPRSAADFERVKQDIVAWRAEEAARIQRDATLSPADARVALLALTKKELQLLQQLDQRRREVGKTREEVAFVHNLDRMAAPKQWGTVHVVTPETERAGELRDLYERLVQTNSAVSMRMASSKKAAAATTSTTTAHSPGATTASPQSTMSGSLQGGKSVNAAASQATPVAATPADEGLTTVTAARLDILLRVKWTVREFQSSSTLARELGELIDREADLLHRGRRDASLSGLRRRIQALFAEFIEDPAFNPGVKDFVQTARGRARVKAVEAERSLQQTKTQRTSA